MLIKACDSLPRQPSQVGRATIPVRPHTPLRTAVLAWIVPLTPRQLRGEMGIIDQVKMKFSTSSEARGSQLCIQQTARRIDSLSIAGLERLVTLDHHLGS